MKHVPLEDDIVITIPVMIDSVKREDEFEMTRCTYFSIEVTSPSANWQVVTNGNSIPVYLIGMEGIIWRPLNGDGSFDDHRKIDELFNEIEDNYDLFVDINDLWLPNHLFHQSYLDKARVFRLSLKAFNLALQFRYGHLDPESFFKSSKDLKKEIKYSASETKAFRKWSEEHIKMAREIYPKDEKMALDWKEMKS